MDKILLNMRLFNSQHIKLMQRYISKDAHATSSSINPSNVPGLSPAVCKIPNSEVGPGATKNGEYKNPEYYCYNSASYFEAEIEMSKYRCPQPSSKIKK